MDKIKKFKPMLCPVCGEMYFSGPHKDDYEWKVQEYINGEVQCSHCGWIYELEQVNNPDTYTGFNDKTLSEYRKWYEEKIKENPDYDYLDENLPEPVPYIFQYVENMNLKIMDFVKYVHIVVGKMMNIKKKNQMIQMVLMVFR